MSILRDMPIKRRVFWVIMVTSMLSVIVGSGISMSFSVRYRRESLRRDLTSLSDMISDNCLVPLEYNIPEDAVKLLASLKRRQSIAYAEMHDAQGNNFANYHRGSNMDLVPEHDAEVSSDGHIIVGGYLHVWQPIMFEGKQIGNLHLFDDMSDVRQALRRDMIILSIVVIMVMVVAFVMTVSLHSLISNPIAYLSEVAKRISLDGDYSVRAEHRTGGEIGLLVRSFNNMLGHIEDANRQQESLVQELEEKNIELERFTYTVSHDLKSPLITIKGFMGQLRKHLQSGAQDRVDKDLNRVEGAADKMSNLLKDLLELSRVGRVGGDVRTITFDELVNNTLTQLEGVIQARGVVIHVDDDMPEVTIDTMRFAEVVQNLVENAVKFMGEQEKPVISIGSRVDAETNVFFVRDNGMGIEEDYREKVFGLFEQLNQNIEGTGIGLTIVRRIIEFHRGRIWVEDGGDGCGVAFCFTIPPTGDLNNENGDDKDDG
jgi:signal transduction histidine kinase